MLYLSIEMSTGSGSLALFRDRTVIDDMQWEDTPRQHNQLFSGWRELLERNSIKQSAIEGILVGRGPGRYSSLRMAISSAQAFSLVDEPAALPIFAVSSCEAMAWQAMRLSGAEACAVIGDARRGLIWNGVFCNDGHLLSQEEPWTLSPIEELKQRIPEQAMVISPDAIRLEDQYQISELFGETFNRNDRLPTAKEIGSLAVEKIILGLTSEPIVPLYLQPPV